MSSSTDSSTANWTCRDRAEAGQDGHIRRSDAVARPRHAGTGTRQLNPATDPATLSVFADDQWNLTPGLFEAHATTTRLNLRSVPEQYRDPIKHYLWQVINRTPSRRQRGQLHSQVALSTLPLVLPRLTAFALWLQGHHGGSFDVVTEQHLDSYLIDVTNSETSSEHKAELLIEVRSLWSYRERLPAAMRLPTDPPWVGTDRATCSA